MKKNLALTIFVGLFLIAGCAPSGPPLATKAEDILGIYASTSGASHMRFIADGTFRPGPSVMLVTIEPPISTPGEYWFEGKQLYLKYPEDDPICGPRTAVYEVLLSESGAIRFLAIDEPCDRASSSLQGPLDPETGEPTTEFVRIE